MPISGKFPQLENLFRSKTSKKSLAKTSLLKMGKNKNAFYCLSLDAYCNGSDFTTGTSGDLPAQQRSFGADNEMPGVLSGNKASGLPTLLFLVQR